MSFRKYSIFGSTVREPSSSSMQATRISRPAMYSSTTTRSSKLNAYSIAFWASSSVLTSVMPRELSSLHGLTTKGTFTVVGFSTRPLMSSSPFGTWTPLASKICLVVALSVACQIVYSLFPTNGICNRSNRDLYRVIPSTQNMCGTMTSGAILRMCAMASANVRLGAASRAFSSSDSGKLHRSSMPTTAKRNSYRLRSSSSHPSQALAYRTLRS
mmetsp:Transcript_53539/g.139496  ORF Transcript_53539/g.139496 Transcript_53539/m.139496 type:complete len:214 (+) Transcript_53539:972-1613(+)